MAFSIKDTHAADEKVTPNCPQCNSRLVTKRENYAYSPGGLKGFVLRDIRVTRCKRCDAVKVRIPRMTQLHKEIAFQLAGKDTRLLPEEVRFLRKYLGWSSADFAGIMGVRPETVSRWEHGKERMVAPAERLLRLMSVLEEPVEDYPIETFKQIDNRRAKPPKIALEVDAEEWRAVAGGRS